MLLWLAANWGTLLTGAVVLLLAVLPARYLWKEKKQKKASGGCSGGCSGCAMCGSCHPAPPQQNKSSAFPK